MAKSTQQADAQTAQSAGETTMKFLEDAGLGPMSWMGTAWLETMADMNSEVISFLADRIKEDVQTQHKLLHCTRPEDAQKAQLEFLEKAYVQYTVETGKLLKMSMDLLPGGLKNAKSTPL